MTVEYLLEEFEGDKKKAVLMVQSEGPRQSVSIGVDDNGFIMNVINLNVKQVRRLKEHLEVLLADHPLSEKQLKFARRYGRGDLDV